MVVSSLKHSRSLLVIMLVVCQPLETACLTVVHILLVVHIVLNDSSDGMAAVAFPSAEITEPATMLTNVMAEPGIQYAPQVRRDVTISPSAETMQPQKGSLACPLTVLSFSQKKCWLTRILFDDSSDGVAAVVFPTTSEPVTMLRLDAACSRRRLTRLSSDSVEFRKTFLTRSRLG